MELDMGIIGISFEANSSGNNILWRILGCIPVEKYSWYHIDSQDESWDECMKEPLFCKSCYSGEEFKHEIQRPQFVIFTKLQAYAAPSRVGSNICTLQEFLESDCKLLVLIYDCVFVEVYSKEFSTLSALYQSALAQGFSNITYFTQEACRRTTMNVL